ncbi:MAG: hypothetical protein U9N50_12790 [Pseudomonadota bacterium]|nr:hypothetical protein [Pseudomonadota bacterium]
MNTSQDMADKNKLFETDSGSSFDLMKKLPGLLRVLGAGVLLIAMYSFLIKGWQSGNDVMRYFMMLGHTAALATIGLASGHWLKDGKGARLLLTLALASVPANFAILGAFIFSQMGGIDSSLYPNYVAWSSGSMKAALLTSAGAMLILIPVTFLGYTVLARSISKKVALIFLVSNAALLLPFRDPQLVALVVLALTIFSVFFSTKVSHQQIAIKTREGITALGLLFLPLAVLMVRSLWLYSADYFLLSILSITVFLMIRQASTNFETESKMCSTLNALSLLPAFSAIPLISAAMFDAVIISKSLIIPLATFISAGMVYDISRRSHSFAAGYRNIAVGLVLLNTIYNLLIVASLQASLVCIAVGMGLVVLGYQKQYRNIFTSGIVLILTGAIYQAYELVHHFDLTNWFSMAALGVVAIVLASTIESQGGKIKSRLDRWMLTFKSWDK